MAPEVDPQLIEFVELVSQTAGNDVIKIEQLQLPTFMPYWPYMMYIQKLGDDGEFIFRLHGGALVEALGRDMTGERVGIVQNQKVAERRRTQHASVIETLQPIWSSGDLNWNARSFVSWNEVILPMKRSNSLGDTVSYFTFE